MGNVDLKALTIMLFKSTSGFYHKEKRYFSDHCDYRAKQTGNVKLHTEAKHEAVVYKCNHCDFQSAYKHEVPRHIKKSHSTKTAV